MYVLPFRWQQSVVQRPGGPSRLKLYRPHLSDFVCGLAIVKADDRPPTARFALPWSSASPIILLCPYAPPSGDNLRYNDAVKVLSWQYRATQHAGLIRVFIDHLQAQSPHIICTNMWDLTRHWLKPRQLRAIVARIYSLQATAFEPESRGSIYERWSNRIDPLIINKSIMRRKLDGAVRGNYGFVSLWNPNYAH